MIILLSEEDDTDVFLIKKKVPSKFFVIWIKF